MSPITSNQGSYPPSSFIPSSVAHFFSPLPVSSISPPAMPLLTHRRTHTPLIPLTPMALRKEVQYVHWRQNTVITILQDDNPRQPRGVRGLFCFVFSVVFSVFLWCLKAEAAVVCSTWEELVSGCTTKIVTALPWSWTGRLRGCSVSHLTDSSRAWPSICNQLLSCISCLWLPRQGKSHYFWQHLLASCTASGT